MKVFALLTLALTVNFAFAAGCEKYNNFPRYKKAIETVAADNKMSFEELCTHPRYLDVEAQPSRVILRDGEVIPHVRVQLHGEYDSCLFMVRDSDQVITSRRCYSGW